MRKYNISNFDFITSMTKNANVDNTDVANQLDAYTGEEWPPHWMTTCTIKDLYNAATDEELFGDMKILDILWSDSPHCGIKDKRKLLDQDMYSMCLARCAAVALERYKSNDKLLRGNAPKEIEKLLSHNIRLGFIASECSWLQLRDEDGCGWSKSSCWRETYILGRVAVVRSWITLLACVDDTLENIYCNQQNDQCSLHSKLLSLYARMTSSKISSIYLGTENTHFDDCREIMGILKKALWATDTAFIMGGPLVILQPYIDVIEDLRLYVHSDRDLRENSKICTINNSKSLIHGRLWGYGQKCPDSFKIAYIQGLCCPEESPNLTMKDFRKLYFNSDKPVLFRGYGKDWKCVLDQTSVIDNCDATNLEKFPSEDGWCNLSNLHAKYGHRFVPLEVGRHDDDDWHEEVMEFGEFIAKYLVPSVAFDQHQQDERSAKTSKFTYNVAYLAQHPLLDQLSEMKNDFQVPHFIQKGELTRINAWIGTRETVSPCHYDSYENIFVQVCGYKYIKLFTEDNTKYLYRTEGKWLKQKKWPKAQTSNLQQAEAKVSPVDGGTVSQIDVENPNYDVFPLYRNARSYDVILGPGDALYIPAKCWHHIRALTTSISLNFLF